MADKWQTKICLPRFDGERRRIFSKLQILMVTRRVGRQMADKNLSAIFDGERRHIFSKSQKLMVMRRWQTKPGGEVPLP
jgi:hypothetical protein